VTSDPPNLAPEAREQEIERLAQELGRLIQGADPERRQDLKELATALMREEFIHKDEPVPGAGSWCFFWAVRCRLYLAQLGCC
jgi:hypothetical protein